ncbi:hypothetical protein JY97_09405 [Alkalispirochaeta odontotermitis]|nr:hypothetical protein JY97_09405 [Alkalispirochaeta odontotermitis]CAB1081688.1 hypothetical protein D1AOALGA4SA_9334 [Olavius algarvensis Delta 1 endosymbiont]
MDFDSFFRNKVESMLLTASWVEQVQKMLDLTGVSQVWGDRPEWYMWITGAPGVYALVFEEGEVIETADQTLNLGQFVVKCYPYVTASVFDSFSPREREMVSAELFDHTHTPRLEARQYVPETFFTVGSLSFMFDAAESVAMLTFDGLDFLKWSLKTVKTGYGDGLNDAHGKRVIRNIPAWQIGYPLFDRLISLYAFCSKESPAFIGATRSPGFECIVDSHQTPESWVNAETQQYSTSVLFSNATDTKELVDKNWRAHLDPAEEIVFEHTCSHSACVHAAAEGLPQVVINSLWWDLAHSDLKSELASTCGCGDHEHHAVEVK